MKIAILGDIHGCAETLKKLLKALPDDIEQIYSVGDLVDRGPDSKGVVQLCMDNNVKAVRGNHEDMFLDFLDGVGEYDNGLFEMNGGRETIISYGGTCIRTPDFYGDQYTSSVTIPDDHRAYIDSFPHFIETDDFILTHAGIHPMRATGEHGVGKWDDGSDKSNKDLMWNRNEIAVLPKLQLVGHNPVVEVEYVTTGGALAAINIDTCCGKMNPSKLTALIMPTREIIQVICEEV